MKIAAKLMWGQWSQLVGGIRAVGESFIYFLQINNNLSGPLPLPFPGTTKNLLVANDCIFFIIQEREGRMMHHEVIVILIVDMCLHQPTSQLNTDELSSAV